MKILAKSFVFYFALFLVSSVQASNLIEFTYPTVLGFSPSLWSIIGRDEETYTETQIKKIGEDLGCTDVKVLSSFRKNPYGKSQIFVMYDLGSCDTQYRIDLKINIYYTSFSERVYTITDIETKETRTYTFVKNHLKSIN